MIKPQDMSREFLEEFFQEVKQQSPGWFHAIVHQRAKTRSGGRGRHRSYDPTTFEKLSLSEIRPGNLSKLCDEELKEIWIKINQWRKSFEDRKQPIDDLVKASKWILDELRERKIDVEETEPKIEKQIGQVKMIGPVNAPIAFIGASPSKTEAIRGEPLVGRSGETFKEKYLKPLGLSREEVVVGNVSPILLTDLSGKVREPTEDEIEKYKPDLYSDLDQLKPKFVVALGQIARAALGARADLVMPHPVAIRLLGDSGEVARKIKQIKERIDKQGSAEGGEDAQDHWKNNWHRMLPLSGQGKFVYQHHWRGLEEDETKLSDQELSEQGKHSIHGDLRLESNGELFGWAVFIDAKKDQFLSGQADARLTPKSPHPKEWLEIGSDEGYIAQPGEAGSTSQKFSKLFVKDSGIYKIGVVQENSIEIFLDGGVLNGRYLTTFPELGSGDRVWLINRPEDQTPRAEQEDLADVIGDLRRKRRKFLFWGSPNMKPRKIDVRTGRVVKDWISIVKSEIRKQGDQIKRIVYGVVISPYGENGPKEDAHKDWTAPGEIEKTAHAFMKGSKVIGLQHRKKADAQVVESWVEQYPTRQDYLSALNSKPHKVSVRSFGEDVIRSGDWILGVELGEAEWKAYQDGEINAFSPGGFGIRSPISRSDMPKVTFVELVESIKRSG